MPVGIANLMNIKIIWSEQRFSPFVSNIWLARQNLYFQTALFLNLAEQSLLRILVEFNMPANRQPLLQFLVKHQQNFVLVDNKGRNNKIYKFIDMRHTLTIDFLV